MHENVLDQGQMAKILCIILDGLGVLKETLLIRILDYVLVEDCEGGERAVVTYDNKICLALAKGMQSGSGFLCLSVLAQIVKYPPLPGPGTLLLTFFFLL